MEMQLNAETQIWTGKKRKEYLQQLLPTLWVQTPGICNANAALLFPKSILNIGLKCWLQKNVFEDDQPIHIYIYSAKQANA